MPYIPQTYQDLLISTWPETDMSLSAWHAVERCGRKSRKDCPWGPRHSHLPAPRGRIRHYHWGKCTSPPVHKRFHVKSCRTGPGCHPANATSLGRNLPSTHHPSKARPASEGHGSRLPTIWHRGMTDSTAAAQPGRVRVPSRPCNHLLHIHDDRTLIKLLVS